jgi:hypothetical protein
MGAGGAGNTGAGGAGSAGAGGAGNTGVAGAGSTGAAGFGSTGVGGAKGGAGTGGIAKDYQGKVITQGGCGCDVVNSGRVSTFGLSILGVALVLGRRRGSRRRGDRR